MSAAERFKKFNEVAEENARKRKPVPEQAFKLSENPPVNLPDEVEGDKLVQYKKVSSNASAAYANMVFGDETAGKAYPGSFLWADALTKDMRLEPIFAPKRQSPVKITVENAIMNDGAPSTYDTDGTNESFVRAFSSILRNVKTSQAKLKVDYSEASDSRAALLEVGISAKGWGASVSSDLEQTKSSDRFSLLVSIEQAYFTISCAPLAGETYFDQTMFEEAGFSNQLIAQAKAKGEIGVVRRVTYGRRLLVSISKSGSVDEFKLAVKAAFKGFGAEAQGHLTMEERKTLNEADSTLLVIGGKPDSVLVNHLFMPADQMIQALNRYLGQTVNIDSSTSPAAIGFGAEYAYDRSPIVKFDTLSFSSRVRGSSRLRGERIRLSEQIKADSRDAMKLGRGDTEIDSDDWTFTEVKYWFQIGPDNRSLDIRIEYDAREGNGDGATYGDTWLQINKTTRLYTVPDGDPRCIEKIIGNLYGAKHFWHQGGGLFGPQRFPDFGALKNVLVTFDAKGGQDLKVMAFSCQVEEIVELGDAIDWDNVNP